MNPTDLEAIITLPNVLGLFVAVMTVYKVTIIVKAFRKAV